MANIPDLLGPRDNKRRVLKRQFEILKCVQWSEWNRTLFGADDFLVELRFHWNNKNSEVCSVNVSSAQLLNYRAFQRAVLKQRGVVIVDVEEFELGDVGLWPLRLADLIGEDV